jgi:hypothetical protein
MTDSPQNKHSRAIKIFAICIIIAIELTLLELGPRLVLKHSPLGKIYELNHPLPYDTTGDSYGAIRSSAVTVLPPATSLLVRDFSAPELRESNIDLPAPIKEPLAAIVGGSSPYGIGVTNSQYFWWMLDAEKFGGLRYINTAGIGATSTDAVHKLSQTYAAADQVKLLVIYSGDNEWINFRYLQLANTFGKTLHQSVQQLSLYKLMYLGYRFLLQNGPRKNWRRERDETLVSLGDFCIKTRRREFDEENSSYVNKVREQVVARFRGNLENMIRFAKERGTKVVITTSPLKYRLSPCHNLVQLVSEKVAGDEHDQALEELLLQAVSSLKAGDISLAEDKLLQAYRTDPDSALTNHYMGYLYEKKGDPVQARQHFLTARERTIGYGGLMKSLNETVRELGKTENVPVVDLETIFQETSSKIGGGLNDEFIHDWCHPNADGNKLIYTTLKQTLGPLLEEGATTPEK